MTDTYGYARVSTKEQKEDRQLLALWEMKVPRKNIYTDRQSGKDFNRPMYRRLLKRLKEGNFRAVESADPGEKGGYCGTGYATSGYAKGERFDGDIFK